MKMVQGYAGLLPPLDEWQVYEMQLCLEWRFGPFVGLDPFLFSPFQSEDISEMGADLLPYMCHIHLLIENFSH